MTLRTAQLPTNHPILKITSAGVDDMLQLLDSRLRQVTWLAGDEFTALDIMTVFSLTNDADVHAVGSVKVPEYIGVFMMLCPPL